MRTALALFLAVGLGLVACSSVTALTHGGKSVRVLKPESMAACEHKGDVTKANTNSWQDRPTAQLDARNKVLNAASGMGGTHIMAHGFVSHLPTTCEDCVQLAADVYACMGAVADLSPDEAFAPSTPAPVDQPQASEWNHPGHGDACEPFEGGKPDGDACEYDTQCVVCHDGSDCGTVVHRDTFSAKGASCSLPDTAECEKSMPRCCQGVCVRSPN